VYKLFCDYCEHEIRDSDDPEKDHEYVLQVVQDPNGGPVTKRNLLNMDLCKKCTRKFMRLLTEVAGGNVDDVIVGGKKVR
jgi:hypothetical protein